MFKEFKEFALKGSLVDVAAGIIIGIAFGLVIASLVADVIMPPVGLALGNMDFANMYVVLKEGDPGGAYASLDAAKKAGAVTLNYGLFINAIINFLIVAFAMFLVVRGANKYKKAEAATTKECPFCLSKIPIKATRCPSCTSEVSAEG